MDVQRLEFLVESRQCLSVESGADLADVAKGAVFVDPQQQRSEMLARSFWRGETHDDKLVLLMHLHLKPIPGTPLHVRGGKILGNQTLIAPALRQLVGFETVGGQTTGQQNDAVGWHNFLENFASGR